MWPVAYEPKSPVDKAAKVRVQVAAMSSLGQAETYGKVGDKNLSRDEIIAACSFGDIFHCGKDFGDEVTS